MPDFARAILEPTDALGLQTTAADGFHSGGGEQRASYHSMEQSTEGKHAQRYLVSPKVIEVKERAAFRA